MDDVAFLALAESVVRWVDERFGRLAAIAAAAFMILVPLAALIATAAWLIR